ncbi:MAG TPA: GNAT family N-acetyltransferase [Aliidongia sp.]|nr:GNAT family N-acetyltransferase [Aliidongia sp.]
MTPEHVDQAVDAWYRAIDKFVKAQPRGAIEWGARGVHHIVSDTQLVILNGVFCADRQPDPATVAAIAPAAAAAGLPWSIQIRSETPPADIVDIAASYGLTNRIELPFMLKPLDASVADMGGEKLATVRVTSPEDSAAYVAALAGGFGGPPEIFTPFGSPAVLGAPGFSGYLAEVEGVPVATGLTVLDGEWVNIFNISTLPDHRRRGYGRAIMGKILSDAYAAGARHALLHSSSDGRHVYPGLGFRTAESWAVFVADKKADTISP